MHMKKYTLFFLVLLCGTFSGLLADSEGQKDVSSRSNLLKKYDQLKHHVYDPGMTGLDSYLSEIRNSDKANDKNVIKKIHSYFVAYLAFWIDEYIYGQKNCLGFMFDGISPRFYGHIDNHLFKFKTIEQRVLVILNYIIVLFGEDCAIESLPLPASTYEMIIDQAYPNFFQEHYYAASALTGAACAVAGCVVGKYAI